MAQQVEMRKISSSKRKSGIKTGPSYVRNVQEGSSQYVFITGSGSKRRSETRHMTEAQAQAYKTQLEKQ